MRDMLILPGDRMLSDRLQEVILKFSSEKNKDVLKIFTKQMSEMKRTSGAGITARKTEHDKEEKKRQDEEDKLLQAGMGKMIVPPRNRRRSVVKREFLYFLTFKPNNS